MRYRIEGLRRRSQGRKLWAQDLDLDLKVGGWSGWK